ncbi:MAG TPA: NACHT domain-containing protein [Anaerolineae bacterium]
MHTITLVLIALTIATVIYTLIQWIRSEPGSFEPLNVLAATILSALTAVSAWLGRQSDKTETAPQTPIARHLRNRENVLRNIYATWIEGFLHQSLSHAIALELNLTYEPEAVARKVLQVSGQASRLIPVERPIREVFEAHGRSLLIQGDPGSGKTITLLQLGESLIKDAQNDPTQPIPMVLNLSSWAQQRPPLADWLVDEIFVQYQVAKKVTHTWIETNQLLFLLDGLDEVAEAHRDKCIAAINAFKETYPAETVVCSRTADYKMLKNRLNLTTAVRIEPLSDQQVRAYLNQEGLEMQAVRVAINTDTALRELARSPLFLSIMTLAYHGMSRAELKSFGSIEARRSHLFHTYVECMFERRSLPADSCYSKDQAFHWLTNLAHNMHQHNFSAFYIERMQPSWLPGGPWRYHYSDIVGLLIALVGGLIVWLPSTSFLGLVSATGLGLLFGLVIGLETKLRTTRKTITLAEELTWQLPTRTQVLRGMKSALVFGLACGLMALSSVLVATVLGDLARLVRPSDLPMGMLIASISFGFGGGLTFGLVVMLLAFISVREKLQRPRPNQGVRNSQRNALRMALAVGLTVTITFAALSKLVLEPFVGLIIGLLLGRAIRLDISLEGGTLPIVLSFGLGVGLLIYGGRTVIQHYTLRYLLAQHQILPFPFSDARLIAFLDAMVHCIFLRRVGGGWVFIHRTLLEYFASLHPENDRRPAADSRREGLR